MRKTLTGLSFFDREFGGAYRGRVHLVTARERGGKTVIGLQFLKKGLELGERGMMLSAEAAPDLAIHASSIDLNVDEATVADNLLLFDYKDYIQGRDHEENIVLPPEGFQQLSRIIQEEALSRVVLDTALPWINMGRKANMQEHVVSLVRAFERLGPTTLFTLPKPVSPAAQKLRKTIQANVPVAMTIDYSPETGRRTWILNKYLGSEKSEQSVDIEFRQGTGFAAARNKEAEQHRGEDLPDNTFSRFSREHPVSTAKSSDDDGQSSSAPAPSPAEETKSVQKKNTDLSFSKIMLSQ
ncbi:MAG: RAD55 family ATPase [Verrucomicrobiota bacterium]